MEDFFDYDDTDYYRIIRRHKKKIKLREKVREDIEELAEDLNKRKKFRLRMKDISPEEFIRKIEKKK
jgi:hypothetical protein